MWQVMINTMKKKIKSGKRRRECRDGVGSGNGDDFQHRETEKAPLRTSVEIPEGKGASQSHGYVNELST